MRTIKFRGKSIDTQEWVYGDLETAPIKEYSVIHTYKEDEAYKGQVKVVKESVGQFTGLVDKNGTEIYEGDIIESGGIRHLVRFCTEQGRFDCTLTLYVGDQDFDRTERCGLSQRWIDEFGKTVIGNIHDNPDLLKQVCIIEEI